jgi:uncharacterized membrane protein
MSRLGRGLTLAGFLGLFFTLLAFTGWIAPPERIPRALVLALLLFPLLFPLRGLLHGRVSTHAWSSLLALPYLVLGILWLPGGPVARLQGALVVLLSLAWFAGALLHVRGARRPG